MQLNVTNQLYDLMTEALELENLYNNLYYGNGDSDQQAIKFRNAMNKAAQEMLEEQFGLMAGRFNPNDIGVSASEAYTKLRFAIKATRDNIKKIEMFKENESNNIIQNRLIKLNELLEQDEFKKLDFVKDRLIEAKAIIKNIQDIISKDTNVTLTNQNLDALNKIVMEFNRDPLLYNQAGDLFEQLIPLIELRSSQLAEDELVKKMKEVAKIANTGSLQVKIDVPDLLSSENLDFDIQQGNISIKTESIRSKTDVVINYKDKKGKDHNNIQVSAKSISGKHIKLVEETTLYRVFMLSQNYNFATHYLNVISISNGEGKNSASQILEANTLAKSIALKMGAEGYDLNNPSEILIVNNRKEKHIYVYNLKALVYLITDAMTNQGKYTNIIKGLSDNFTINQNFDKNGAENRIGKLVNVLNQVKITGTLGGNQLNNYLSVLNTFT